VEQHILGTFDHSVRQATQEGRRYWEVLRYKGVTAQSVSRLVLDHRVYRTYFRTFMTSPRFGLKYKLHGKHIDFVLRPVERTGFLPRVNAGENRCGLIKNAKYLHTKPVR
jgi:hypothetical protein